MGIVRPRITYGAIVWAKVASNHKKQLDRVQRLGLLAMAHVRRSTPTAGMEAALDMMPLDLYAQCAAVKATIRIWGRNSSYWDGIGCGRLRGHLFWGGKILRGMDPVGDLTEKWKVKDLFYDKWKTRWSDLSTCRQTKFWIEDPDCLGDMPLHAWIV